MDFLPTRRNTAHAGKEKLTGEIKRKQQVDNASHRRKRFTGARRKK
ncbi:MAG: hypothetical protein KAW12_26235 [Candidatus Aminicenantes bacterium]|nr:hypothetical protein [Candidatus Aminicenantes bacterium]